MRPSRDNVFTGLIALSGLAFAVVLIVGIVWQGPLVRRDVCAGCGLHRKRDVWQVPGTRFAVWWRGQQTNSAVSLVLQTHSLNRESHHRWVSLEEYQLNVMAAPTPGGSPGGPTLASLGRTLAQAAAKGAPREFRARKLTYQFDSKEVAQFVQTLHERASPATVQKWMGWLGHPQVSPHVLGVAVRFGQEAPRLADRVTLATWLESEEATLMFGKPPPTE